MDNHLEPRLVEILHKLGLTELQLRDHVIRPANFGDGLVQFDLRMPGDGDPDKEPRLPPPPAGWLSSRRILNMPILPLAPISINPFNCP